MTEPTLANIYATLCVLSSRFDTFEKEASLAHAEHRNERREIIDRLSLLEADLNVRRGERGIWSMVCRNPILAWFLTVLATAWAYLTHMGEGVAK